MKTFGIDISYWQKGYPYNEANKEGIKFAILRAGFREQKDSVFETHYSNAKRLGWGVGAYWYSYATTVEGAKREAQAFIKAVKGKKFEYPLYLDLEDKSQRGLGKKLLGEMVEAFGKIIEDEGYYFGVYTNLDWYRNIIDGAGLNKRFDWWIAAWNKTAPTNVSYGLWQFGGSTNKIRDAKIAGVVTDQNYAYKDYPAIMKEKGLNGYSNNGDDCDDNENNNEENCNTGLKFKINDKVIINGDLYSNSNAKKASGTVTNKITNITRVVEGAAHPYNTTGDLGWMNEEDIKLYEETSKQKFSIGDKVIINGKLYSNSNASKASGTVSNKVTNITRYNEGSLHPYNTTGDLGWMDEEDIQPYTQQTYTVKEGDTLSGIASKYGMTWQQLYAKNKFVIGNNPNIIKAGQVLKI